jgi:hypothetical protein
LRRDAVGTKAEGGHVTPPPLPTSAAAEAGVSRPWAPALSAAAP